MKIHPHIRTKAIQALCVLALSPALLMAQGTSTPAKGGEAQGIVKSVDQSAHTLVLTGHKKNPDQVFQWNAQTKFTGSKPATDASALKAGEHVHITYTGGMPPVLQSVQIAPEKGDKHSMNNHAPTFGKSPQS